MSTAPLGPPYGPPANLRTIVEAWRSRGLPPVVDRAWFERIGLSANLATRNLHALRYLRLVDDDGRPTELADRLRVASADDFRATLAAIVRTSYARIWAIRDPAGESRARIDDAFRYESPPAQRARMVALFIGLCQMAGIPIAAGPGPDVRRRPAPTPRLVSPPAAATPAVDATPPVAPAGRDLLLALLDKFPVFDPAWPDSIKEKWFDAFAHLHANVVGPERPTSRARSESGSPET